jgi:UDP-N-acetylmuramate--alanine ligase
MPGRNPSKGFTSQIIFDKIRVRRRNLLCKNGELIALLREKDVEVLVTFGAGDIDRLLPEIEQVLTEKYLSGSK